MALTYDGTNGLFTRLGALIYMMDAVRTHQNNLMTLLANVQAEYSSTDAYMIDSLTGGIEGRIEQTGGILTDIKAAAESTLREMCWAEAQGSTTNNMPSRSTRDALIWLIRQMNADGETIEENVVTVTSAGASASNTGDGTMAYLIEQPAVLLGTGNTWQNIRKEVLVARCTSDAQSGGIADGSERFTVVGGLAYPPLDYRYPAGSGAKFEIDSVHAAVDSGARGQNILTNSDFEDWTGVNLDQWTVSSGTAGTDFLKETSTVGRGSAAIKMAATGSTFKIRQRLGDPAGTLGQLVPDQPYVISFLMRKDASATGTVAVALEDGSATILSSGDALKTITVSTLSSSAWSIHWVAFRTPRSLPADVYLSIRTSTAIATAAAYIDEVVVAEMQQFDAGSQAIAMLTGAESWVIDDTVYATFTNDFAGAFSTAFDRLFSMYMEGLQLPNNVTGAETILDSLIA